ncbi:MAG: hypothetical protein WCP97_09080 [bacterium]
MKKHKSLFTLWHLLGVLVFGNLVFIIVGFYFEVFNMHDIYSWFMNVVIQATIVFAVFEVRDHFRKQSEDSYKITNSLHDLQRRYSEIEFLSHKDKVIPHQVLLLNTQKKKLEVDFEEKLFELDAFFKMQFFEIMKAHRKALVFNSYAVRLKHYDDLKSKVVLRCEKSTYFNHLVTNLALDFGFHRSGFSIREIFEPGPKLTPFEQSKLSNNLGLNMLIKSSDGYFLFQRKRQDVSISKGKITMSVGGAVLYEDCIRDGKFSFYHAVDHECEEELFHRPAKQPVFLGFGREVDWGGKPQFYFYTQMKQSFAVLHEAFQRVNDESLALLSVEESKLEAFFLEHFEEFEPSAAACLVYYLKMYGKEKSVTR